MAIDISKLNETQLGQLMVQVQARLAALQGEKLTKVRDKVLAMIKSEGIAFADVLGSAKGSKGRAGKKRGKVAPKYCNPADKSQVWSGRGRHPIWFDAAMKAGKTERSLLIK